MPGRVADASVIAAVAFEESRSDEARVLLEGVELFAPTFLTYELTSVARKKALVNPHQLETILEALVEALGLDINWRNVDHPQVLALALETGLTTFDASYLYLARALGLPLVTFDRQLQAANASLGA